LSSELHLIYIYVCTKFNFIPFSTFQDMAGQASIMKNKWLKGDNYVNIQGMIMVIMQCPF